MNDLALFQTCFHRANALAPLALARAMRPLFTKTYVRPIVLCIGSDRVTGDSLGPVAGTLLTCRNAPAFIYGTLSHPITAREVPHLKQFLACTHPLSPVLAVDAAVGKREDVGLLKFLRTPLRPGSGSQKQLGEVGDASILAVVAEKERGFQALENVPLGRIREMAELIAEGVLLALQGRNFGAGAGSREERLQKDERAERF